MIRIIKMAFFTSFYGLVLALGLAGTLAGIGFLIEGWKRHNEMQSICLKGASNGLEIERCKR